MASREVYPKDVVKALRKLGFFVLNTKGSHFRLGHRDGRKVVVAVHPRPLSLGTLHAILRQTEITRSVKKLSFQSRLVNHLAQAIRKKLPKEIGIIEVSEKESLQLNHKYRKKHKPANVLSFLYGKEYGEILLCSAVIRREARAQKHSYKYQLAWMIVHGMIHLSGLHHEKSAAVARRVERLEKTILTKVSKV